MNDNEVVVKYPAQNNDGHWLEDSHVTAFRKQCLDRFSLESVYVKMADGVHLAVDIFLPRHVTGDDDKDRGLVSEPSKFPTVLHFARYNRNWGYKKNSALSCSLLSCYCMCGTLSKYLKFGGGLPGTEGSYWNMRSVMYVEQFLPAGFAWVTVDVRGTGASEGTRPIDLHAVEVSDTKAMAEWVVGQAWCNGSIYSTGISYDGMSALALASHQLPSTKAIAPLFAPFDLMDELSHPGGIRCIGFTKEYGQFVHHLERDAPNKANYPPLMKLLIKLLVQGVRPVDNAPECMHENAILQHAENWDMLETQREIMNRDDPGGPVQSIDEISVHMKSEEIATSKTEHLSVSGWYDSGTALGAVRYYLSAAKEWSSDSGLRHPRLLLGPWNHGARNNCSPFATTDKPQFPLVTELLRFFANESSDEDQIFPVHYFTVGEEVWKGSRVWPPPHKNVRLSIKGRNRLTFAKTSNDETMPARSIEEEASERELSRVSNIDLGCTVWDIDKTSTTREISRCNLVKHIFKIPITYPERQDQDEHNLLMDSDPLESPFEVTGHPFVTLYVQVDSEDAGIFVYLEEDFPDGRVVYGLRHGRSTAAGSTQDEIQGHFPLRELRTISLLPKNGLPAAETWRGPCASNYPLLPYFLPFFCWLVDPSEYCCLRHAQL